MLNKFFILMQFLAVYVLFIPLLSYAESSKSDFRIGFIGSLTGIASNYGKEALEGVKLAIQESKKTSVKFNLIVEDDASNMKNTVMAFHKLHTVDKVDAIITGTWWANAIVKPAEAANIPLVSVETSFNKDTVLGKTYFLMLGDLKEWIHIFEPLIVENGWNKGAIIHFTSGFGQTLAEGMNNVFSKNNRSLVPALEYTDIDASEARSFALRIKAANPDVLYIDGQPSNLANILKRLHELQLNNLPILTNSIAQDMCEQKLFDCSKIKDLFFNRRVLLQPSFIEKFKTAYGRVPYLSADIAYYSTKLIMSAIKKTEPISFLKHNVHNIDGVALRFDERNVLAELNQEIWQIQKGVISRKN